MSAIPDDVLKSALECWGSMPKEAGGIHHIARAILAERKRCAEWCDKTAFLEWEQGELRAQRALRIARDNILSGDDA